MQEYEIRGFGICFNHNKCGETTVEKINKMLEEAPNLKKEISEWFEDLEVEKPTIEDYSDFEQDKYCGIPALLAMAINEKYNVDFLEYDADDNGLVYVYMPQLMPWQMTDFEKNLTENELINILSFFYNILYTKEAEIGDVSIRQFG